jgi:hypothetical protein
VPWPIPVASRRPCQWPRAGLDASPVPPPWWRAGLSGMCLGGEHSPAIQQLFLQWCGSHQSETETATVPSCWPPPAAARRGSIVSTLRRLLDFEASRRLLPVVPPPPGPPEDTARPRLPAPSWLPPPPVPGAVSARPRPPASACTRPASRRATEDAAGFTNCGLPAASTPRDTAPPPLPPARPVPMPASSISSCCTLLLPLARDAPPACTT